jgi:3-oxoadipate enol-lactonase
LPFVSVAGVDLHYTDIGTGPALCLITGFRQNSAAWPEAFISELATRCRVITFDNRGTGQSDKPMNGYSLGQQASDVVGLLDKLGLSCCHILGFSMGGAIAQEFAVRFPDRIGRLILFAMFCGGIWSERAPWSVLRRLFAIDGLSPVEAARQSWPVTYTPAYLAANAEAVERQMYRELLHPTPEFVAKRQIEALRTFDRYRDLPRIGAATLVVTGSDDILIRPGNSVILASRIPRARLESLADLGHRAIWEASEEIAGLVNDFLAGPSPFQTPARRP